MTIGSEKDLRRLEEIGKIVSIARSEMIKQAKPGMTTRELDGIGKEVLTHFGARSAPMTEYDFPGYTCISVNDVAAHGIPGDTILQAGDMINVDVSAERGGYYADTGATIVLGGNQLKERLVECSRTALLKSIEVARAGSRLNQIGKTIHEESKRNGFTVVKNLTGHGIGKKLHEAPKHIFNYYESKDKRILTSGLVLAIETFVSTGAEYVTEDNDGWTLRTPDGSFVAQFEHTIVVTENQPIILTA